MIERLLHVIASPRGERSRSAEVAAAYLSALKKNLPTLQVEELDLWQTALPRLGGSMIAGRYRLIHGEPVPDTMKRTWEEVRLHVEHFLSFDAWLIATPMWNFGIPYPLKHWIDVLTQPGMTFTNDARGLVTGRAAGRKAVIIAAGALDITEGSALQHLDFQVAYLTTWLNFIGVTEIHAVKVAPTFGPPDAVEGAMARASEEAARLAASL